MVFWISTEISPEIPTKILLEDNQWITPRIFQGIPQETELTQLQFLKLKFAKKKWCVHSCAKCLMGPRECLAGIRPRKSSKKLQKFIKYWRKKFLQCFLKKFLQKHFQIFLQRFFSEVISFRDSLRNAFKDSLQNPSNNCSRDSHRDYSTDCSKSRFTYKKNFYTDVLRNFPRNSSPEIFLEKGQGLIEKILWKYVV